MADNVGLDSPLPSCPSKVFVCPQEILEYRSSNSAVIIHIRTGWMPGPIQQTVRTWGIQYDTSGEEQTLGEDENSPSKSVNFLLGLFHMTNSASLTHTSKYPPPPHTHTQASLNCVLTNGLSFIIPFFQELKIHIFLGRFIVVLFPNYPQPLWLYLR